MSLGLSSVMGALAMDGSGATAIQMGFNASKELSVLAVKLGVNLTTILCTFMWEYISLNLLGY